GAPVAAQRSALLRPQEVHPVLFVTALRVGQGEQDGLLLTAAARCEIPVDGSLGPFGREVLAPALELLLGRCARGVHESDSLRSSDRPKVSFTRLPGGAPDPMAGQHVDARLANYSPSRTSV